MSTTITRRFWAVIQDGHLDAPLFGIHGTTFHGSQADARAERDQARLDCGEHGDGIDYVRIDARITLVDDPKEGTPWWQDCTHVCPRCDGAWMLDDSDADAVCVATERSPHGNSWCTSTCPTCGQCVTTSRKHVQLLETAHGLAERHV